MTNEELVSKIKAGIDVADNMLQLWQQNYGFIHAQAKRYMGKAEMNDLDQEGYLALYDAVDGYNPEYGYKFLTYAGVWINQRMQRYIQNNALVRIPEKEGQKIREYKKVVNAFRVQFGRKPSQREIAHDLGMSVNQVVDIEKTAYFEQIGSLDSYLTEDEEDGITLDIVAGDIDVEGDVLADVQNKHLKSILWPLVDALPDNQGKVLLERYRGNKTLREAGESIGATVDQVKNIETKALRSIRYSRHARVLMSFCDEEVYNMGISGTSAKRFNNTWMSATERAAFQICENQRNSIK